MGSAGCLTYRVAARGRTAFQEAVFQVLPGLLPICRRGRLAGMTKETLKKERILIVDDHPVVRQSLADLLSQEPDLEVCGFAQNMGETLAQVEKLNPALAILDITLPGVNGLELLKQLRASYPNLKVVMLSMHDETLYALRAIRAGAQGYVMKHEATDEILKAIRAALAGELHLSAAMERQALRQMTRSDKAAGSPLDLLSDRELEVFSLIGDGKSTAQIADQLNLSIKTIESHRAHIKEKLNLASGTQLVQHAIHWRSTQTGTAEYRPT